MGTGVGEGRVRGCGVVHLLVAVVLVLHRCVPTSTAGSVQQVPQRVYSQSEHFSEIDQKIQSMLSLLYIKFIHPRSDKINQVQH